MKINYQMIPSEHFSNYYGFLIGRVFKILPMKEANNLDLGKYLESLQREVIGNMSLVNDLKYDGYFIALLNKIQFLISQEYDNVVCKTTVFECIDLVKKVQKEYGCDDNG